jgi:hypothetical protein
MRSPSIEVVSVVHDAGDVSEGIDHRCGDEPFAVLHRALKLLGLIGSDAGLAVADGPLTRLAVEGYVDGCIGEGSDWSPMPIRESQLSA